VKAAAQLIVRPPLTLAVWPVTKDASIVITAAKIVTMQVDSGLKYLTGQLYS
jgi:hypothetical protein